MLCRIFSRIRSRGLSRNRFPYIPFLINFNTKSASAGNQDSQFKLAAPKSVILNPLCWAFPISANTNSRSRSRPRLTQQSFCRHLTMSAPNEDLMDANRLVWIDLEMTGLDVEKERIIEIACLVTEGDLTIVAKGPNLVIHQSDALLNSMDEWCTLHHGQSGLTEAVRNCTITTEEAEAKVLSFVSQYVPPGKCPLAGNSVGTDKMFIERYMPRLAKHLHYRIVDVSTVKELCRRWHPDDLKRAPAKKLTHRAMDDILESIEELKYYRGAIIKS